MGCQQSTSNSVIQPTKITQIQTTLLPQSLKHTQSKKNQILSIPNNEFHLKWLDHIHQSISTQNLQSLVNLAYELFINNYILQCIELNKKIIQFNPLFNSSLQGLGSKQMATARYQWNVTGWYKKQVQQNKMKLSHYDLLALSFLTLSYSNKKYLNQLKKGLLWYQSILTQNSQHIAIMMGYANLFSCTDSYDQAIKLYDQVIQKDAYFKNAYISKALIYEYKRINYDMANEIATKINYLFGSNQYAQFILARNIVDVDQKINKLKQAATKHPFYVRIINEVGICYGAKKEDYDQAIEWYKKCVQLQPQYYSAYNNIGVNNQLKKNYQQARKWYYKAIMVMQQYAAPHNNLADVYQQINYTNQQIQTQVKKQEQINFASFCWQQGSAFYNKKQTKFVQRAIYWHQKSVQLKPQKYEYWNSLGIAYDELNQCQKAIQKYLKAVELNPQYQSGYYNIGIAYKSLNMLDKTQQYYKKAVQVNPKYSYAWNNLANIYKNKQQYQQAIEYYQHAIEYNSTYTLALANLGICELKLGKYKQAFLTFSKAKSALPNDNNNLSQSNKVFLKEHLDKFDQQGQKWKHSGSVTDQQKQSLKRLIQQFQKKFKNIAAAIKQIQVPTQKILQPQILSIIKILKQDQFQLKKIQQIFQLISTIFHQDEEYFHIVPLLIIQKFTAGVFVKKEEVMVVEKQVKAVMERVAEKVAKNQIQVNNNNGQSYQPAKIPNIKLQQSIITNSKVNLFEDTLYFTNAEELYIEINRINIQAKKSYTDFSLLVQETRKKSNGIPGGISTKIPSKQSQQFKVMLRIMQKLFKKEMDEDRKLKIIKNINNKLKQLNSPTLDAVVRQVMTQWNNEITSILQLRKQNQLQTQFSISDLLRARCIYTNIGDLIKAIQVVDGYCKVFGYEIIQVDNRLAKRQTQDVVFKIRIKKAVCELQLAMKQDQKLTHLDHCVYEILRSPLGVIFGSYLFMSKQVKYPFTTNCKDIVEKLKDDDKDDMLLVRQCAQYVLGELQRVGKKEG